MTITRMLGTVERERERESYSLKDGRKACFDVQLNNNKIIGILP